MKGISLITKFFISIDKSKENSVAETLDNILFAATVGFVSGAIYGVHHYYGSLATGAVGLFIGGLSGFVGDRLIFRK